MSWRKMVLIKVNGTLIDPPQVFEFGDVQYPERTIICDIEKIKFEDRKRKGWKDGTTGSK